MKYLRVVNVIEVRITTKNFEDDNDLIFNTYLNYALEGLIRAGELAINSNDEEQMVSIQSSTIHLILGNIQILLCKLIFSWLMVSPSECAKIMEEIINSINITTFATCVNIICYFLFK